MSKKLTVDASLSEPRIVRFDWLCAAGKASGKALHLGVALLWLAAVRGGPRVQLTRRGMRRFNLSRDACYDSLKRLEAAGLVKVWRLPGRSPMITLMEPRAEETPLWVPL